LGWLSNGTLQPLQLSPQKRKAWDVCCDAVLGCKPWSQQWDEMKGDTFNVLNITKHMSDSLHVWQMERVMVYKLRPSE